MRSAFTMIEGIGPVVATAVHAGHDLRPEVAAAIKIDDEDRRREEDPATDQLVGIADTQIVVHRSRFEVDLNRPRERAVYRAPAWGHDVWNGDPSDDVLARSLEIHDDFYWRLSAHLDRLAARGPFVLLDIHSYNHRRDGAAERPGAQIENPEVNVGTSSLDRTRWAGVVDRFIDDLGAQIVGGHHLDVRENVRFKGGHLVRWLHECYPAHGCGLAIELKKTYIDEWTGAIDREHVTELAAALAATVPGLLHALQAVST
jgi:N-formylglutamate deformylase